MKTFKFIEPSLPYREIRNTDTLNHSHTQREFEYLCSTWLQSFYTNLRTSFLVRVYLGSGICLCFKYSPLLTSLFTRVRTVRISSLSELHRKQWKHITYCIIQYILFVFRNHLNVSHQKHSRIFIQNYNSFSVFAQVSTSLLSELNTGPRSDPN